MDQNNQYQDMDSYQAIRQGKTKKRKDSGAFIGGIVVGMIGTLVIACVIILVWWQAGNVSARKSDEDAEETTTTSTKKSSKSSKKVSGDGFVTDEMVTKVNGLVEAIREKYFLDEVTDEQLENGIYRGLMNSLGDPYTEYYTAQEYNDLMQGAEGIYYGIGAYVSIDEETQLPKLGTIFKQSPAEKAGLKTDDLIYKVDGELTYGKTLTEVVTCIKGDENTDVVLTIIRNGQQQDVTATRGKVETPTVEYKMLDDKMGYLQLTEFDDVSTKQFLDGMEELYDAGMQGLILDLRANPGGNLSTVVQIAQNLLPKGTIVYTEDKEGNKQYYKSKGNKEIQIPLVVLIDGNSASASEILAGAIQDYKKGTLVGTKSYGKGIVQTIYPARDGSAIKITTSGYFTPNGRNIHKVGIEPDVVCEFDSELYYNEENPVDNQLEKAKEVLADLMKQAK